MTADGLIARFAPGASFIDVGGLWGTVNEKVSVALAAGARTATMLDMQAADSPLWSAFHAHCAARGATGYDCVVGNLDDPALPDRLGAFDLVHCSGVIYHCPDPLRTLQQLRRLTRHRLLLTSMTVPPVVATAAGEVDFRDGRLIAVPALTGAARAAMAAYFETKSIQVHNINTPEEHAWRLPDGTPNYAPWWWLWTAETLAALAATAGFAASTIADAWPGYSHCLLCEVVA